MGNSPRGGDSKIPMFSFTCGPSFAPDQVNLYEVWMPWSATLLRGGCPDYLIEATRRDKAEQLLEPLGLTNLDEFRSRLQQRADTLNKTVGRLNPFFDPLAGLKPDLIGAK